jgi:hypothetical protein
MSFNVGIGGIGNGSTPLFIPIDGEFGMTPTLQLGNRQQDKLDKTEHTIFTTGIPWRTNSLANLALHSLGIIQQINL